MSKDKTLYKWRLVFKTGRSYGVSKTKDLSTYRNSYDLTPVEFHDFAGTDEDCSKEWDKWTKNGYDIQDAYNLGIYRKNE